MKPNVLIAIDTAAVGGPGKGVLQLLRRIPSADARLSVATFSSSRHHSSEFLERLNAEKRRVIVLREKRRFDPSPLFQAAGAVRAGGINLLQSHGYKAHLLCAILSRSLKLPWLAVMNGYTREDLKVRLYHSLDSLSLRYADAIAAVSPALFERAVKIKGGPERVQIIANAVDVDDLQGQGSGPALRARIAPKNEVVVGVIGRMSPEKGQAFLLSAYAGSRNTLPPLKLVFVGDGPLRPHMQDMASSLGLDDSVVFEGHTASVRDYFSALDMLVLPSLNEGLPNVVLEAMAYDVPVLASAVGGVPDLIKDGVNGWLYPAGDIAALRDKLTLALSERHKWPAITARARQMLYPRYCPIERAKRFLLLYQQLLLKEKVTEVADLSRAA